MNTTKTDVVCSLKSAPGYSCPACSGKRHHQTFTAGVVTCDRCGAVHGRCYLGDSYGIVKPFMTADPAATERQRYFDFETVGSAGLARRHGWFDPTTGLMTQVG